MNMRMNEEAKVSAKRLGDRLKMLYPAAAFDVLPGDDQLMVFWTDGPTSTEVRAAVRAFAAAERERLQAEDLWIPVGYQIAGKMQVGARYVEIHRSMTPERKALRDEAVGQLEELERAPIDPDAAERFVMEVGVRQSKLGPTSSPNPQSQATEKSEPAKVVPFPGILESMSIVDQLMGELTTEQKFKVYCLYRLCGDEALTILLTRSQNVDELFRAMAHRLIPQ